MARVSVIIPCYNREVLLCETLDSVRAQTLDDWEVLVVDDHSQDKSLEVAQRYARLDGRIRAVARQGIRKGGNICRNEGLSLAQGEYVVFLDSDDLLSRTCLAQRVAAMDQAFDCGYGVYQTEVFTRVVGDRKLLWNVYSAADDLQRFLKLDTVWLTSGPIWRRRVLQQLGGFDESILSYQDWDLHVRALIARIKYFKEAVVDNYHRENYERSNQVSAIKETHPDHLKCHEELFERTFVLLQAAGPIDRNVRRYVTAMFWSLAKFWQAKKETQAARDVWLKPMKLGLCSYRNYLEGRLILVIASCRGCKRAVRILERLWLP